MGPLKKYCRDLVHIRRAVVGYWDMGAFGRDWKLETSEEEYRYLMWIFIEVLPDAPSEHGYLRTWRHVPLRVSPRSI